MMLRIKHTLIGAALCVLPAAAFAEDTAQRASPEAAARELISAQDLVGQMTKAGEVIGKLTQDQLASSDTASAKSAGNLIHTMLSPAAPAMTKFLEQMEAVEIKVYQADLTPDEMNQLAAFLRSEVYKKYQTANLKALADSSAIVTEFQRGIQLAAFESLTKEQPKNAVPWNGLCWFLVTKGGDTNRALEACDTAIRLNPRFPNAFDSRGLVYLKLGDYHRALADYDMALKLCPRMAGAAYGRGVSKIKLGDFAGGSEDIIQAKTANAALVTQFASYGIK